MDMLQSFKDFIDREHLFSANDKLLLAVSGGVDSVVLCELCYQAGFDFIIVHCNFQLRGEESDRDEAFVKSLAQRYPREVIVGQFDTGSHAAFKKVSIQVAARELRYRWFHQMVAGSDSGQRPPSGEPQAAACKWIVTAHHLDDNIETLLMNFFKGTGIAGLRAILPRQGKIVRPLLFAEKDALVQFARARGLEWVEDSSNISDKYTRNYFRHQVIPLLSQLYPGVTHNLADNIARFREIEVLYRQSVERNKLKLLEPKGDEIHIPVLKLKKSSPLSTLIYEIIQPYGFSPQQVNEVVGLLESGSGKYVASSSHRILKNRGWLIISPLRTIGTGHILIEHPDEKIAYENGELKLEFLPMSAIPASLIAGNIAFLDGDAIQFPLLLRKWRPGDYFYPLGMKKKKKLARFFIDNKLSLTDKEKVWVIETDKKIVWVVGLRIDDRFRITPNTRNILKIETGMA
jgi:tRNA(Ile)-lysidine synthase